MRERLRSYLTEPQERVERLAEKLVARLQPYVDGDMATFRIDMKDEVARLANHAFGAPILHIVGCAPHDLTEHLSSYTCSQISFLFSSFDTLVVKIVYRPDIYISCP